MSLARWSLAGVVAIAGLLAPAQGASAAERQPRVLRVCADPNNLPFSNDRGQGFDNAIAAIVARELHARLEYTWWAQRRGFIRNTLKAGSCDLVLGLPQGFGQALTTAPYYRSSYVFVTRRDRHLALGSFDDAALRRLRIGVQLIGDDYSNTPPAHALSSRGIVDNVRGFPLYGDYRKSSPPARILEALARNDIDVAIVWGPLAGYFASREQVPLVLAPVPPAQDGGVLPMVYAISAGVRHGDETLKAEVEAALQRRRADVQRVLRRFGVPLVRTPETAEVSK